MAEAKWFAALLLVLASSFVDYTLLAAAVLLCAALWLLVHMAGVGVRGSVRLECGAGPATGHVRATLTLLQRDPPPRG